MNFACNSTQTRREGIRYQRRLLVRRLVSVVSLSGAKILKRKIERRAAARAHYLSRSRSLTGDQVAAILNGSNGDSFQNGEMSDFSFFTNGPPSSKTLIAYSPGDIGILLKVAFLELPNVIVGLFL